MKINYTSPLIKHGVGIEGTENFDCRIIPDTQVLLNGALLALFTGEFGIGVLQSQAIALVITSSYSFIGHMYWTFKVRLPKR